MRLVSNMNCLNTPAKRATGSDAMNLFVKRAYDDDHFEEVITFSGKLNLREIANLRLNELDRALLEDVGSDVKASPADYLLLLEMLFRRSAEQENKDNPWVDLGKYAGTFDILPGLKAEVSREF